MEAGRAEATANVVLDEHAWSPPRLPPDSKRRSLVESRRALSRTDLPETSGRPSPAAAEDEAPPVAAEPDVWIPDDAAPRRIVRWWRGPSRRLVELDARDVAALERADPSVHRRYQDRARWRIR